MAHLSQSIKHILVQSALVMLVVSHAAMAGEPPAAAQSDSKQSRLIELPAEAVQKLKIDAGFGWGIFSGTIYNGSENYHVTQLVVSMEPIHGHHHMDTHAAMSHDPKIHHINLDLPPVSKGALSMPLASEDVHIHDFKWKIIKVMGYQTR